MKGEKQQTDDLPCSRGHKPTIRYVNSGLCVDCVRENYHNRADEAKETYKTRRRAKLVTKNPSKPYVMKVTLERLLDWFNALESSVDSPMSSYWLEMKDNITAIEAALTYKGEKKK